MDGDTTTVLGNYINAGQKVDTAVYKGRLFVAYFDDASIFRGYPTEVKSSWRLIYWNGSSWVQNTLEGGGSGLFNPTVSSPLSDINMEPYGNTSLQIFYKGEKSQLRHLWIKG